DYEHLHDCGDGFYLFHRPSASARARILVARAQRWMDGTPLPHARRAHFSRSANFQSGRRYRGRRGDLARIVRKNRCARNFLYNDLRIAGRVRFLWEGIMTRLACQALGRCGHRRLLPAFVIVLVLGAAKLPIECELSAAHRQGNFRGVEFNLDLRERVGQLGFIAALSGFRSIVADVLFLQTRVAWERTEWGRLLWLFRQITTLQPRAILFWDMAAWHMAWNASVAVLNDRTQPRLALRIKAQKEYFALGKDFLERGIKNNPKRP